ncbi:NADH:flavin oxidoreductase [Paraburkholderia panacisoli]|uniref:NADH:flavin oxidoreductase n=1 Tax=Paraburkholderia panacisoli TaxID=2603818 RepID=A0A5B0GKT9_9BURK|nr:NADH:flavin oxidoreductase [Paraburkholderia panacisoli]KAA1004057.1 NADH:flavin oxidoreductase [Paraburkholderia panacisoli]
MPLHSADVLFRPFRVKSLELKNRIVMAPMTRAKAPGGIPEYANVAYYQRRAAADVGLILSEGTVVNRPASRNEPGVPFFHGHAALDGWKKVIDVVHSEGGRMGPQIWHVGSLGGKSGWEPGSPVESPSGLVAPGKERGVQMSDENIADTISAFARAAGEAKRLGFDTLEIHGAHGYLIDQFFWADTNRRPDGYGGTTLKERSRFASEIVAAVRAMVGDNFPIILRVSQWKQQDYSARLAESPAAMADWLGPLVDAGVDMLHCSQRRFWEPEFPDDDGQNGLNFAGWAKKLTGALTISVGSVGLSGDAVDSFAGKRSTNIGLERLIERMEREEFDLIAVGRALLGDPQWAEKIKAGAHADLNGFDPSAFAELI